MNKDFESVKHRYNANSYLEIFEAEVVSIFEGLNTEYQFMQDNVFIHYACKMKV